MKNMFSKLVVIGIVVLNVWFTRKLLNIMPSLSFEPVTLIASWFAFTTGELVILAGIRKAKAKSETGGML